MIKFAILFKTGTNEKCPTLFTNSQQFIYFFNRPFPGIGLRAGSWCLLTPGDSSRLDNFTTKYLVYETLNELTITADKSKFGKNTLELMREASMIFGIAVAVNQEFDGSPTFTVDIEKSKFKLDLLKDDILFNQTLDMVLNICIENPEI